MLQINKLTISHIYDNRILIKDFTYTCNKGDKVAIIGEEGNGKSTLLKWIYNPSLIESYTEVTCASITNSEKIGYLAQELPHDDSNKTVYEYFSSCDEFLEAVNPIYAVIQSGKNNYGHPSPEVIEKCQKKGIMVLRNDYNGAVGFSFRKSRIYCHVMIDRKE